MKSKQKTREENLEVLKKRVPIYAAYIAPVYKMLKWTWRQKNGSRVDPYIPTAKDIAKVLSSLISSMKDINLEYVSSGGLAVTYTEANIKKNIEMDDCYMSFTIDYHSYEGVEN